MQRRGATDKVQRWAVLITVLKVPREKIGVLNTRSPIGRDVADPTEPAARKGCQGHTLEGRRRSLGLCLEVCTDTDLKAAASSGSVLIWIGLNKDTLEPILLCGSALSCLGVGCEQPVQVIES